MKSNTSVPVDSFDFFDGFIVPGEASGDESEREYIVPPIRVMDPDEVWDRNYARSRLAVPDDAKVVYVQLGAGRINDIEDLLNKILAALFAQDHVYVVLGESMLGERLDVHHERLRGFAITPIHSTSRALMLRFRLAVTIHFKRCVPLGCRPCSFLTPIQVWTIKSSDASKQKKKDGV